MANIPAPPTRLRTRLNVMDTGVQKFARDYPVITLSGRRFTTVSLDGTPTELDSKTLDIVIVDALPGIGRKYYDGAYNPDAAVPPSCWSNDGQTPAKSVEDPRAASCASCKFGAAGSGQDGKSTACGFIKPLICYMAEDQGETPTLYRLDCKAMSLFGGRQQVGYLPWNGGKEQAGYVKNLYNEVMSGVPEDNKHFSNVVTRICFTSDSVPALGFQFAGWVEDFDLDFMETLSADSYVKMLEVTAPGEVSAGKAAVASRERGEALPAPAAPTRAATASAARAPVQEQEQEQEQEQPAPTARRGARSEPEQPAATSRRTPRGTQEVIPPEPEQPGGRRGRGAAVPSKITPAVISGNVGDDPEVADLAARIASM